MSEYNYPVVQGALKRYAAAPSGHNIVDRSSDLWSTETIATDASSESRQTICVIASGEIKRPHCLTVRSTPDTLFYDVSDTATLLFDTDVIRRASEAARASATMALGQVLEFRGREFPEDAISDVHFPRRTIFTKRVTLTTKDLPRWKPAVTSDDILG